jgi:hypothetical protein
MSRSHRPGNYGIIPSDEYLRKIQSSSVVEDPDAYEKYIRSNLADFRPDEPFFESDQIRHPNDRGGGFGSAERLSLRHSGSRTEAEPYLPDGTFLDYEFLERDPRGTQNMPNFDAARAQRMARGKFIKYKNDDDFSVPETGINPVNMVQNIRNMQYQMKDRYINFDESFDSWHNGGINERGNHRAISMTTEDGTIVNLADATYQERQDPVTLLSNRTAAMLRHTTPDHRVKSARYGQVRPMMGINENAWSVNRNNANLDHSFVEVNGQMVNRTLGLLILDLEGQRSTKQVVAHSTNFADSGVTQLRESQKKIDAGDLYKLIAIGMKTQPNAPAPVINDNRMRNEQLNVTKTLHSAKIAHEVANSMAQVNRLPSVKEAKDVRKAVASSAADYGLYVSNINKEHSKQVNNNLKRESFDTRHIEEELETKLYGNIIPSKHYNPHEKLAYEEFTQESHNTQRRFKNGKGAKNITVDDTSNEVDMKEFDLPKRKKMGRPVNMGRSLIPKAGDVSFSDSVDLHDTLVEMVRS